MYSCAMSFLVWLLVDGFWVRCRARCAPSPRCSWCGRSFICPLLTRCLPVKFPEETEGDLLSVTIDEPSHPHHHHPPHSPFSAIDDTHSVFSAPCTPAVFSSTLPFQHEDMRRDELSSSSSEDSEKEDEFERERPLSYRRPL